MSIIPHYRLQIGTSARIAGSLYVQFPEINKKEGTPLCWGERKAKGGGLGGRSGTLLSKLNFQAGTLKHDLLAACCLLLSRWDVAGEAVAPLQPRPPSELLATGRHSPVQWVTPTLQLQPGSAAPLEVRAAITATPPSPPLHPPRIKNKIIIS